ncbi:MAG TPA: hypothetical protein VFB82_11705, partial [Blastocatellia bacterium]|nr:hypothetical protein [Blastocatellia bacterium]
SSHLTSTFIVSASTDAIPLGLGAVSTRCPKVAEYGNLGLWDAIPLGLGAVSTRCPEVAEYGNLGLWDAIPLGCGAFSTRCPKVAEYGNLGLWDAIPLGLGPIRNDPSRRKVRKSPLVISRLRFPLPR